MQSVWQRTGIRNPLWLWYLLLASDSPVHVVFLADKPSSGHCLRAL